MRQNDLTISGNLGRRRSYSSKGTRPVRTERRLRLGRAKRAFRPTPAVPAERAVESPRAR
jgi:hypothetical protein